MQKLFTFIAAAGLSGVVSLTAQAAYLPKLVAEAPTTLVQGAESGRPGRGGDGGGLPGLPGGQGGQSGAARARESDRESSPRWFGGSGRSSGKVYYRSLASYCNALERQYRRWWWLRKPVRSELFEPDDCEDFWDRRGRSVTKRGGYDGRSIAGGSGGRGGRDGAGPGGGRGGSGGAGIAGGSGGRGGAGGAGY